MELEQIKRQLQEALSPRTPPLSLTRGDARSCGIVRYESDWMNGLFLGKAWHEVDLAPFKGAQGGDLIDALSCLRPEAVAYYLPVYALLVAELESIDPLEALAGRLKDERVRAAIHGMYGQAELHGFARVLDGIAKEVVEAAEERALVAELTSALEDLPPPDPDPG
jgi:hypothetical protein